MQRFLVKKSQKSKKVLNRNQKDMGFLLVITNIIELSAQLANVLLQSKAIPTEESKLKIKTMKL